jgi:tetratricopeptide (TPR) repeat protein
MADSALATQERLWGPDDPRLAPAMGSVAEAMWGTKDLAAHEALLRRMIALAARDSVLGIFTGVHGRNLLAISLRDQGRLEEAEGVLREILADRERLGQVYPVGLDHALTGLGHVQLAAGHAEEAAASYREVLERRRQSWGTNHPEVANALVNLAQALGRSGHFDESRRLYDEGLAMRRATQGDGHAEIGVDMVGLGDIQQLEGDGEAAVRTYAEALVRLRETHGAEHPLTIEVAEKIDAARLNGAR